MPLSPGFMDYALELVAGLGKVESKRMFGGAGLYRNGVMFALLDDDVLYFRVDDMLQADLKAQGSVPWVYSMKRDGAVRDMGYWRMPETAADDPDEAVALAKRAYAAAVKRKALRETIPAKKAPAKKARAKK
jgi:DNA transformation protein